jgi:hypothetical protein
MELELDERWCISMYGDSEGFSVKVYDMKKRGSDIIVATQCSTEVDALSAAIMWIKQQAR